MQLPELVKSKLNVHQKQLASYMPALGKILPRDVANTETVFLCYTNRCGSNYLADLLASTRKFNKAGEIFNYNVVITNAKARQLADLVDYFAWFAKTYGRRKRLVCKVSLGQVALLHSAGILPALGEHAKFLHIERADLLGQAISLALAGVTGKWTSYGEAKQPESAAVYDRDKIEKLIGHIAHEQYLFKLFFGTNGIVPHRVVYETLVAQPQITVSGIVRWLGGAGAKIDPAKVKTQKQASEINESWRAQFLAER